MGLYKYIREAWKKPKKNLPELYRQRLIEWRQEPSTVRIERPTRLDRARALGYRAKQGIIVVRQKVIRGGRMKLRRKAGRRPKRMSRRKDLDLNYKEVAEKRANMKYKNCEVLNSYPLIKDGKYYWFEVILVDRAHPAILKDKNLSWISRQKGRVNRGLTSAGRKSGK